MSYIRRKERFAQPISACTDPNFGCGKFPDCSEYPNGCMTGNGDCCCPGPACEGFGNVRRPRRVVRCRREGFGNVHRPRRVVRRENFGKNCSDIYDKTECENNGDMHNPSCCWNNGKCEVGGMPWGC